MIKNKFDQNKKKVRKDLNQQKSKYLKKRAVIKIIIIFLIFGVLAIVVYSLSSTSKKRISLFERSSSKLAYGKGISFVEYHGDKKVYAVSIDSFSIEREKLGPFSIGPLSVAHLKNVKVDIYLDEAEGEISPHPNLLPLRPERTRLWREGEKEERVVPQREKGKSSENPLPPGERTEVRGGEKQGLNLENPLSGIKRNLPKEIKKVRGIKLKDISFNIWRDEKKIFSISSESATIDKETGDIIFTGHATIDAGNNGKLVSHRIRWSKKTQLFSVPDSYYLIKDGRRTEGKGIETDYLLRKINYNF